MGKENRHLDVQLIQRNYKLRAVGFGKSEWVEALSAADCSFDFAFKPVVNEFNGYRKVELHLIDYHLSSDATGNTE